MRAGVAGGVLSTLAVAGASSAASAAESTTQTLELPALTADLAAQIAESADATQQAAANYELQAERDAAAAKAAQEARKDLAEAKQKAEAKKKAEAARKAAAEAAVSRSVERATLSASDSSSDSDSGSASASSQVTAPASGSVATVIDFLKAQLGDAYVMGASGPNAWDCSSLVQAAFKEVGVDLPRVSQDQSMAGTDVSLSNLEVGDILYWGAKGSAYHVGVYVGNGEYLDAANPSKGVVIQDLSGYPATGAVRVL